MWDPHILVHNVEYVTETTICVKMLCSSIFCSTGGLMVTINAFLTQQFMLYTTTFVLVNEELRFVHFLRFCFTCMFIT
jgi:hypothetical protein